MDSSITPSTQRVPYDLLRPIFEHLESDKPSLCATSLVSSDFREEAQRILFRDVTTVMAYTSHVKFLRTVAASPTRLALFVHAFRQGWSFETRPTHEEFLKILTTVVADGLKAMRCLKWLHITPPLPFPDASHPTYLQILSACTFRLERFDWQVRQWNANELVEGFLVHQPTVKHLGLIRINASLTDPLRPVPSTTCPQLISVTACWPIIRVLLPGHNLSILRINFGGNSSISEMDIKPLAAELGAVKALSVPFYFIREREPGDPAIPQYFPSLNALEIYAIYNPYDTDDEEIYTPLEIPGLGGILSNLPTLRTLILSNLPEKRDRREDAELADRLFAKFGTHLKRIDIKLSSSLYTTYIQSEEIVEDVRDEDLRKLWLMT